MIGAEAGSSGAGKSSRGSVDGTNQGEASRLLQPAIKEKTRDGNSNDQRQSEVSVDVQRRNSKDQKPEKKARISEEIEVMEEVVHDVEGDERNDEELEKRRWKKMEAKREKSHTTKRVEVLEDEAYI